MSYWNFQFKHLKSEFDFFDFISGQKEYKVEPATAVISYFKVYTVNKGDYGEKLTGIRCYSSNEKVVLNAGWF